MRQEMALKIKAQAFNTLAMRFNLTKQLHNASGTGCCPDWSASELFVFETRRTA